MSLSESVRSKLWSIWSRPVRLPSSEPDSSQYIRLRRARRPSSTILVVALLILLGIFWPFHSSSRELPQDWHKGLPGFKGPVLEAHIEPCHGPGDVPTDVEHSIHLNSFDEPTPQPFAGSYKDLGLEQRWITAVERYGRYGRPSSSHHSDTASFDWDTVNWASLQNKCLAHNQARYGGDVKPITSARCLKTPTWKDWSLLHSTFHKLPHRTKRRDGRTAIVLRAWSTFVWADEDIWSLRSLITETALASGGRYSVFILMDVKKEHTKVHPDCWENDKFYNHLLDTLVPAEFRNMTVLFNKELLEKWYPAVEEHRPEYQMFQPLQLFAQHFPEFNYFWTMEMDIRFTGHTGSLLESFEDFARREPRKQARQRMSHYFLPGVHGTYDKFVKSVNNVLDGGDAYYEGVRIPDVDKPIGRSSPFRDPQHDKFEWGVGEDADFITFSPSNNVTLHNKWLYRDYINKFKLGMKTPGRVINPVTVSRTSWNLLNEVHNHQVEKGLRLPTESTMGSFALWHGLKISLPPLPMYSQQDHRFEPDDLDLFLNGGPPSRKYDGMAVGQWIYDHDGDGQEYHTNTTVGPDFDITYRYKTPYPQALWDTWLQGDRLEDDIDHEELPSIVVKDGKVYLPNTMLHPVKTNTHDPANNEPPAIVRMFGVLEC